MKKIMSFPNVVLLHPSINSDEIIDNSKLVISIRGSSPIEAALRKKPSITFGKIGMYQISTMNTLNSITDLPKIIRNAIKQKVDEKEIDRYLKLVYHNTFEFPESKIVNGFQHQFKVGGYYSNVEINSDKMLKFIEKHKKELEFLALKHVDKIKQNIDNSYNQ